MNRDIIEKTVVFGIVVVVGDGGLQMWFASEEGWVRSW